MTSSTAKRRLLAASALAAAAFLMACESKEQKAVRFVESAEEFLEEGDVEAANLQYNNALFQDPLNVDALRGAAEIAKGNQNVQRQARMLFRLLEEVPNDIDANNEYAQLLFAREELDEARRRVEQVLELDPNNVTALTTLASILLVQERLEEANDVISRGLEIDTDNTDLYILLAARSVIDEDIDAAFETIDRSVDVVADPEPVLVLRLGLSDQYRSPDEVLATFDQLLERAPENGVHRMNLAIYHMQKFRDFGKARDIFEEALPFVEEKTEVLTRIVAIDQQLEGSEVAEATLRRFVEEYPDDTELQFAVPVFYCRLQQFDTCTEEFNKLLAKPDISTANRIRALNGLADVSVINEDMDGARALAEQILEIDDEDPGALITLGQVDLAIEETDRAIRSFREALQSVPNSSEALVYLALAYEQAGQIDFADAQFAKALDEVGYTNQGSNNSKAVVDQYRAFLNRTNDAERANEILERYVRANPNDVQAQLQAAQGALQENDFEEAARSARQLIVSGQDNAQTQTILAQSFFGQQRFDEALPIVEELLGQAPENSALYIMRAGILQNLGRAEEAITELRAKIDAGEAEAVDYALLGDLYNNRNEFGLARAVSVEGLSRFPTSEQLFVLAYLSQMRADDTIGAMATLQDGIQKADETINLRTFLANELIKSGRSDEAIDVLRTLHKENELSAVTANNFASLLLEKGDENELALEVARTLERGSLPEEVPAFADTISWAYFKAGQLQNAMRFSRIARTGLPNNPDVLFHAAMIDISLGDTERARTALERAKQQYAAEENFVQITLEEIEAALADL